MKGVRWRGQAVPPAAVRGWARRAEQRRKAGAGAEAGRDGPRQLPRRGARLECGSWPHVATFMETCSAGAAAAAKGRSAAASPPAGTATSRSCGAAFTGKSGSAAAEGSGLRRASRSRIASICAQPGPRRAAAQRPRRVAERRPTAEPAAPRPDRCGSGFPFRRRGAGPGGPLLPGVAGPSRGPGPRDSVGRCSSLPSAAPVGRAGWARAAVKLPRWGWQPEARDPERGNGLRGNGLRGNGICRRKLPAAASAASLRAKDPSSSEQRAEDGGLSAALCTGATRN